MPNGKVKIFTEEFSVDKNSDVADTIGVLYFKLPTGQTEKVYRYFVSSLDDAGKVNYTEITQEEYAFRKKTWEKHVAEEQETNG